MKKQQRNILLAFVLNLIFSAIEFVGGFFSNSITILSDAFHDFGDSLSIGLSFLFERKAQKSENDVYTYGYIRYSVISALLTSLFLLASTGYIVYSAIERIIQPEPVQALWLIILSVFGIVVNGTAAYITLRTKHLNEKSINIHMLEDVLTWVVVLISGIVIHFFNIPLIDPILSLCVAAYIIVEVIRNLISVFSVLLEKTPKNFKMKQYKCAIRAIPEICDVHHVHIWTLDGINLIGTLHVTIQPNTSSKWNEIKEIIRKKSENFKVNHLTIELEGESDKCFNKIHETDAENITEGNRQKVNSKSID